MNLVLLVRADSRGLATQSGELHRHLKPWRSVIVDLSSNSPYELRAERFPDAYACLAPEILYDTAEDWLDGADVMLTVETPYKFELIARARKLGVKTVVQANAEFMHWAVDPGLPRPDLLLAPSTWRLDTFPPPWAYLPMPVARDRLPFRRRESCLTVFHPAGHPAIADRNGTIIVLEALRMVRTRVTAVIRSMRPVLPPRWRPGRNVDLHTIVEDVPNYWDCYPAEADVCLLPRRFGGLSLPLNEASSLGMPVVMTDCEPQASLLPREALVSARQRRTLRTQGGTVDLHDVDPRRLAQRIDRLVTQPEVVAELSDASDAYADSIAWNRWLPAYRSVLEDVGTGRPLRGVYEALRAPQSSGVGHDT